MCSYGIGNTEMLYKIVVVVDKNKRLLPLQAATANIFLVCNKSSKEVFWISLNKPAFHG